MTQRILIIDESMEDRGLVTDVFHEAFSVPIDHIVHARSGAEALAIVQRDGRFDWLFLDPDLPDMEGLELLERMTGMLTQPECRKVVVSARRDRAALVTAAALGVKDYIVKPLEWQRFLGRVRRLAFGDERRRSERVEVIAHYNVAMEFEGIAPYAGRLMDISMGGCQVKSTAFDHGGFVWDPVRLFIIGPSGQLELPATLLRAEADQEAPAVRLGFRFPTLDPGHFDALTRFVAALKRERAAQQGSAH